MCWTPGGWELWSIRITFSTDKQTCRPIRTTAAGNWAHFPSGGLQGWGHPSPELDHYLNPPLADTHMQIHWIWWHTLRISPGCIIILSKLIEANTHTYCGIYEVTGTNQPLEFITASTNDPTWSLQSAQVCTSDGRLENRSSLMVSLEDSCLLCILIHVCLFLCKRHMQKLLNYTLTLNRFHKILNNFLW